VGAGARVAATAQLGPYVVVAPGASIGERCVLDAHVFVGAGSSLGPDGRIYPFVSIREGVTIGHRVTVHSNTTIGSDGFGFAPEGTAYRKIPQVGSVEIGDDVEIGANCTIDRGALAATRIGRGSKLDNQVHVAHNVEVGEDCLLVAQVGISGSVKLGNHVTLGGKTGVAGHLSIGDNAAAGAMSGIGHDLEAGEQVWGAPSNPLPLQLRINVALRKLPELLTRVRKLEKKLGLSDAEPK
jgi:UDP-3-O-[3-hydroxymyristoyl] glucosamine N-acyltransferase